VLLFPVEGFFELHSRATQQGKDNILGQNDNFPGNWKIQDDFK